MSLKNTFALDDNDRTYTKNLDNGVLIPPYEPGPFIDELREEDTALLKFKYWLLQPEVIDSKDVTSLNKNKIFTTSLNSYRKKAASY
jgi:hypothetical protein